MASILQRFGNEAVTKAEKNGYEMVVGAVNQFDEK